MQDERNARKTSQIFFQETHKKTSGELTVPMSPNKMG